jgi:BolA protein
MSNNQRVEKIEAALEEALAPEYLHVIDESHKHVGHAGAQSGGGHFKVIISSAAFTGLNRIASHRLINAALADMLKHDIHALSIKIKPMAYA